MKRILYLIFLLPVAGFGVDQRQVNEMLANAAAAQGKAYLEARQAILSLGRDVLPLLVQASNDANRSWQQRLAARICYERIMREKDIETFRSYEWRKHPDYKKDWERNILGASFRMGIVVKPVCEEFGLWYYYLELRWKLTDEYAIAPFDRRINENWVGWCASAVGEQPEYWYLRNILVERLERDTQFSGETSRGAFAYLRYKKDSETVPVLIKRLSAYIARCAPPILTPREIDAATALRVEEISAFADSRHADLIEKFIAERPALAPLKDKVAEIRKRPAPPPREEPPFRLGQKLVNEKGQLLKRENG